MLLRHEAKEGEDDQTGKHGGAGVNAADDESVLVDVVVVFVVRAERHNGSQSKSVREENLQNVSRIIIIVFVRETNIRYLT